MRNGAHIIIRYDAAFTSARMLVGALSAVYLLRHGVSVVNIGLMKSMQAAIYFAFDIPSSYLADRYSRKAATIIATVLGGLWLLLTGLANSVPLFFCAEALNALSLTILGGTIQAYIIDNADDIDNIHRILGRVNRLSFFFMALSGLAGAGLAAINDRLPWLLGGALCLILAFGFGFRLPAPVIKRSAAAASLEQAEQRGLRHFFTSLARLFSAGAVLRQAFCMISLALIFQFLLQYWQILVSLRGGALSYGLLFTAILLAQSLAGHITTKLPHRPAVFYAVLAAAWVCLGGLSFGICSGSAAAALGALVLLFGIMQILLSFCGARLHIMLPSEIRAASESVVSTSAKFLVMLLMPLVAYAAAHGSWLWFCGFLGLLLGFCTALTVLKPRQKAAEDTALC